MERATMYLFTSSQVEDADIELQDKRTNDSFSFRLQGGHAAIRLIDTSGVVRASYGGEIVNDQPR
jgi:hypothetical protein